MSEVCSSCQSPAYYLQRAGGHKLCPRCLFEFTKFTSQFQPSDVPHASNPMPKFTVEQFYPPSSSYVSLPRGEESSTQSKIRCEAHNQPASNFLFTDNVQKMYLCESCLTPDIRKKQDLLPISADITHSEQINAYYFKINIVDKVEKVRNKLEEQKKQFDAELQAVFEHYKSIVEVVFTEIASVADAEYAKFQTSLALVESEISAWEYTTPSFASETALFIHYFDAPLDQFQFYDIEREVSSRVSIIPLQWNGVLRSFSSYLDTLGPMCECERCEGMRGVFDLPSARTWTCLQCKTLCVLTKGCPTCGCGPTIKQFLEYRSVELQEDGSKWVCTNCKAVNSTDTKDCAKCKYESREAEKGFVLPVPTLTSLMVVLTLYSRLGAKPGLRWCLVTVLLLGYCFRLWTTHGFYLLTYCVSLYNFTLVIGFITPIEDPTSTAPDEFRPFLRSISELRLWENSAVSVLCGVLCTYCPFFNLPIYWPILPVTFLVISSFLLYKQLSHMREHRYVPWTVNKATHIDA